MFSGHDRERYVVLADELEGAEVADGGGAAADAFAGALEGNYSRRRIADGGFSAGRRENRGAVFAQRRFRAENISGGWERGWWNCVAAARDRGGSHWPVEIERGFLFVSIVRRAGDGLSVRIGRARARSVGEAGRAC